MNEEEIKALRRYIEISGNRIFATFKVENISNLLCCYEESQQDRDKYKNIVDELEQKNKLLKNVLYDIRETIKDFNITQRKETGAFWFRVMGTIDGVLETEQELKGSDE